MRTATFTPTASAIGDERAHRCQPRQFKCFFCLLYKGQPIPEDARMTTSSTVTYGRRPASRGLGGGAPTFGSAYSTKGTFVAAPPSRQVVADRGQALVSASRVGPVRPSSDNKPGGNPMGGSANYKSAFKTPGYTSFKGGSIVDVAHCKGMKGRFEHAFEVSENSTDPGYCCYGLTPGSQYGKVQRPQSAGRMLGFKELCGKDLPAMPNTAQRERDLVLHDTGVYLDNVLARAGV